MTERVFQLLQGLNRTLDDVATKPAGEITSNQEKHRTENHAPRWLSAIDADEMSEFIHGLQQVDPRKQLDPAGVDRALRVLLTLPAAQGADRVLIRSDLAADVAALYGTWRATPLPRHLLLALLIRRGDAIAWHTFAALTAVDPPADPQRAIEAFAPLWRVPEGPFAELFPRLLDAIQHLSVAVLVLDLANYLVKQGILPSHPGLDRAAQLLDLFGQLVERLEGFEMACRQQGVVALDVARQVTETVALAVALCHALALMDYRAATGKMFRMMALSHRRLRTEAAAALARWSEEAGIQALVDLAAEPLVRLRVLAYADELGIADAIGPQHRSEAALAEAELVTRLADSACFGIPPTHIQLRDSRPLYWPGFDAPQQCFLFEYQYSLPQGELSNIGLAGPVAHTLAADLRGLSCGDIYAAYAGWHVEHAEIRQIAIDPAVTAQRLEVARGVEQLRRMDYHRVEPVMIGSLFGERSLVAWASRAGVEGMAIVTAYDIDWIPAGDSDRPIDAVTAWQIHVGRLLLRQFNDDWDQFQSRRIL